MFIIEIIKIWLGQQNKIGWDTTKFCWLESNQMFCCPNQTIFSVILFYIFELLDAC